MVYRVEPTAQAEAEIDRIYAYISGRSVEGDHRWYESYWEAAERLRTNLFSCALASENDDFEVEVRDLLFRTSRCRIYRALFTVEGDCVRILAVRGEGERPVKPKDIET